MKTIAAFLVLLSLVACKNDPKTSNGEEVSNLPTKVNEAEDSTTVRSTFEDSLMLSEENIELQRTKSIQIKRKELYEKKDEKNELQELLVSRSIYIDEDLYVLDFKYPYLNEDFRASYANFNEYISEYYIDAEGVEAQILEDKELYCDTVRVNKTREKRKVDYKVYNVNEKLISVLFYKENYYSGAMHPSYTFDCLNFDLTRSVFMNFEDFFSLFEVR